MSSNSSLLLKCLALLLAFAHLGTCVYPPVDKRPRFNCPLDPPPPGINTRRFSSLYKYCVSRVPSCDCYKDRRMSQSDSIVYKPVCDFARLSDQHDTELQRSLRYCENTCMCYGGPQQNFAQWPWGPPPVVD